MARPSKPWYRKDRDAWVSKVNGRLHTLARGPRARGEAVRALARLLAGLEAAAPRRACSGLYGAVAAAWSEHVGRWVERGEVKASTWRSHTERLVPVLEAFGDRPVSSVGADEFGGWLASRPWSRSTRWCHAATVRAMLRWAVREKVLAGDPLEGLAVPGPERRRCVVRPAEVRRLLAALPERVRPVVELVYLTGARPGEVVRVTAADVDLKARTMTLSEHKTARKVGRARVIFLPAAAVPLVRAAVRRHPEGPIFRTTVGSPWSPNYVNRIVRRVGKQVGVDLVVYQLRHAFATDLLSAGVPVSVVSPLLGHADARTTLQVYDQTRERTEVLSRAVARRRA